MNGLSPLSFLDAVSGYARQTTGSSADKPARIAVIDPTYTSGLPKVTFEGESTLSTKGYPFAQSYYPRATERVILIPVGTTWLIVCAIDDGTHNVVSTEAAGPLGLLVEAHSTAATSTTGTAQTNAMKDTGVGDVAFTAVSGRAYRVSYEARLRGSVAGVNASLTIRDGNASTPTSASGVIAADECWLAQAGGSSGGNDLRKATHVLVCPGDITAGTHTIAGFYRRIVGSASAVNVDSSEGMPRQLYVEDLGVYP